MDLSKQEIDGQVAGKQRRSAPRTARAGWQALVLHLAASLVVVLAPAQVWSAGAAGPSDDLFLLTTSVAPNVLVVLDNSGSMNHLEWHEDFDPNAGAYACAAFTNTSTYFGSDFGNSGTFCGNTRTIYKPEGNNTRYDGRYLNWYFSDAADLAYANDIQTAVAVTAGCGNGASAYDDKYRRSRFDAARQVLLDLACVASSRGVRLGLAEFRTPGGANDPTGGFTAVDVKTLDATQMLALENHVDNASANSWTPLAETLFQSYSYFMSRSNSDIPVGADGSTQFPRYEYDLAGVQRGSSSDWAEDPVQYACQRNFIVVITDGEATRDDFDSDPSSTSLGFDDFDDLIGDYNPDGETEDPFFCCEGTAYLDDIAMFMNGNDFRPDFAGDQNIDTYTVGFSTEALANGLLAKTAAAGNGAFYYTKTGDELANALLAALNNIIEKSQSFTAASVPSARTESGGTFYQSFFFPRASTAFWEGHLRAWNITSSGDITDKFDLCALDDLDAGECNSGTFKPTATPHWDAHDQVPAPAARKLYTSRIAAGVGVRDGFDQGLTASDLGLSPFAAAPNPAPNDAGYPLVGSTALDEEGLADELVEYARGCAFGTGVLAGNVATPQACTTRVARLGDIFHSGPVVIGRPRVVSGEASSLAYHFAYQNRGRMLYAGANDGFLHAFEAGVWDTNLDPSQYTPGTGVEKFGFMPWEARQNIKVKPVDDPLDRTFFVDAAPQVADVWFHSVDDDTTKTVDEWHTLLVGGMRQGGHQYYALDVSNPDEVAGPEPYGRAFPAYLWEFPREDDPGADQQWLGETWGEPIITRIKVADTTTPGVAHSRWVVIVSGGYERSGNPNDVNYDANVMAGRSLFVLDAKTGAVLAEQKYSASAPDDRNQMNYAFAATPAVFDTDGDGHADLIYAVDLGGQVFKWVIRGAASLADASQPGWTFRRFFYAPVGQVAGVDRYKNIFFAPSAAFMGGNLWLTIGTGERDEIAYPGDSGTTNDNNWFYVMRDSDLYELAATPQATLTAADLSDVTAVGGPTPLGGAGYRVMLGDGEKVVTNSEIFAGTVLAATFTPDTSGIDPCTMKGTGTLYAFELSSGGGYFDDGMGNPVRGVALGAGLPTDPKTSVGPDGKDNRVYVEKSDTELMSFDADDLNLGGQGLYWREKNN